MWASVQRHQLRSHRLRQAVVRASAYGAHQAATLGAPAGSSRGCPPHAEDAEADQRVQGPSGDLCRRTGAASPA